MLDMINISFIHKGNANQFSLTSRKSANETRGVGKNLTVKV